MIHFLYPDKENRESLLSLCGTSEQGAVARGLVEELIAEEDDACDIAVCFSHGTFLTRRFYEEYEFTYPLALCEDADIEGALCAIEEYCKRAELPLIYGDLTDEEQLALKGRYRLSRTEEFDISEDDESPMWMYRLRVLTPCEILDTPPTISDGVVTIDALTESDIPRYAALCRDENILAVWGVDYRDINPDMTDRDFYENALDEAERGIALALAVRTGGQFVGEVALYAFDGRGGAEFSLRILPEAQRQGIAKRTLPLLFEIAKEELMLEHIDGICLQENTPSKRLMASFMTLEGDNEESVHYRVRL
ncbi:MAG: GNAT family N-acetyltransferase [Clostridia bacterium]|nr:GNAT family N-acetyltransferase [Clostridia bacterium]